MKSTFRVLFFLKRDKVKKNGNMPIMARITIDGKLVQFNTKLEVNPKNWQAKTGKVSGRGAEFTRMNEMLDGIKATLYKHYQTILERNGYVTAEKVRNTFLGKECLPFFLHVMDKMMQSFVMTKRCNICLS